MDVAFSPHWPLNQMAMTLRCPIREVAKSAGMLLLELSTARSRECPALVTSVGLPSVTGPVTVACLRCPKPVTLDWLCLHLSDRGSVPRSFFLLVDHLREKWIDDTGPLKAIRPAL